MRFREHDLRLGILSPGPLNAITDLAGVRVGHVTLNEGPDTRTGVTAIVPAPGSLFQSKLPAAVFTGNGFGKLAGSTQVNELGNVETPILLTNTLSVAPCIDALVDHALGEEGNETVRSVNALVGETNDGVLNDIRARRVTRKHALDAVARAQDGPVAEGCVGAGTGTIAFGFKAGIGTASRVLPASLGGYCVAVLVQSNFGGVLSIGGVPVGQRLGKTPFAKDLPPDPGGSCMIVVGTGAPLDHRNLSRLAARAFLGLARTGNFASNASGEYAIAFSTNPATRVPHRPDAPTQSVPQLHNDHLSPLFLAAVEATEEAVINSLFAARTTTGFKNTTIEALPLDRVLPMLKR